MNSNDKINRSRPGQQRSADPARHARRCAICNHPERDAIEEEFVHWFHADRIAEHYKLPSRSAVYRHAYATGLYDLRRRNMRYALEHLIEEARLATPVTGDTVIRAVRAHAHLTATGRWIEPPKEIIVSRRTIPNNSAALPAKSGGTRKAPSDASRSAGPGLVQHCEETLSCHKNAHAAGRATDFLTGTPKQLETPATTTKQTTAVLPNRDTNTTLAEAN
jgi:hypothetical protein